MTNIGRASSAASIARGTPSGAPRADFASYRTKPKRNPALCLICNRPKIECWDDGTKELPAPPAQNPKSEAADAGANL